MSIRNAVDSAPRILTRADLPDLAVHLHQAGRTVVWTNGCFDLLHAGHARSLRAARQMGDILVVGVNSDESIRRLKGSGRPVIPASERAELVASLACVDHVIVFDDNTAEQCVRILRPNVFCKGIDYAPPNGKPVYEEATLKSFGCRIAFLPFVEGLSTSSLIARIKLLPEDFIHDCKSK